MKIYRHLLFFGLALLPVFALDFQPASAFAQGTEFTYQGRVTVGGTDFTGAGQFQFALVTSTNYSQQATAVADMGGSSPHEFVNGFTLINGGSGYTAAPGVTISGGGGSGATATTTISGGEVISVNVIDPGSGYTSTPTVTIDPPPPNIAYTTYWSNDGTSVNGSEPASAVSVAVSNGLFTVILGDTTLPNMAPMNASIFAQPYLQLRIWFNDGTHGFAALNPVQPLTPAPYAIGVQGPVPATNLTGTISAGQLGGAYSGAVTFNNGSNSFAGTFNGNGSSLTNLSPDSLVLDSTNTSLTSWGDDQNGQREIPTNAESAIGMAAGEFHSLALMANGTVIAWGAGETNNPADGNDYGQAIVPAGLSNAVAVSAGALHSLALLGNGSIVGWGYSADGETNVPPGLNAIAISAGAFHNLALQAGGTVVAWGAGETNEDASPDWGQSIVPPGLNNVTAVAAGAAFSAALKNNGTVVVWGGDEYGVTNVPAGLSGVTAIAAGGVHVLALKSNGTVVAWGEGETNNPGDGLDYGQSIVPSGLSNVVAIAAGLFNSVALKSDGTVVAWGDDTYGESTVPSGLDNVLAIATGPAAAHVLAIRKQSDAPVAWLDSDNTFNGNITVNGDTTVSGELYGSDLRLDDGDLWLRSGSDENNGLGWYSAGTRNFSGSFYSGPDGPVLFGEGGGALGTSGTNGQQVALVWNSSGQVGLGTTTPGARLDLGGDAANSKLLLYDSYNSMGLGANGSQFMFNLGGGGGRFSFMDAPGGNELMSVMTYGGGVGYVGIGTTTPATTLDVHGTITMGPSGQYYASGSQENLRIVCGQVNNTGTILTGTGFSVVHSATGGYTVTFSPAFSGTPVVVATVQHGVAQMATVSSPSASVVYIDTWNSDGSASDQYFQFIAMGPP